MLVLDGWWPYYTPQTIVILAYLLAVLMGMGLASMLSWNIHLVSTNQTTVEYYDNGQLAAGARLNRKQFLDAYNHGWKQNWKIFLNAGKGMSYPIWRPLIPSPWDVRGDGIRWDIIPLPPDLQGMVISFGGVDEVHSTDVDSD